jgi:hypothetical protein
MLLVLSTLPHFFTPYALYPFDVKGVSFFSYAATAFLSTCASIEWHYNGEPEDYRMYMVHSLFGLWALQELIYSAILHHRLFAFSSVLNLTVLVLNQYITTLDNPSYLVYHAASHTLSAFKCYMIASLIYRGFSKKYNKAKESKEAFDSVL